MADEMKVSLPEGVVKPIIEAQVIAALAGQERLIGELIKFTLSKQVRDEKDYGTYPFLEWVCRQTLREAIEKAVRAWVTGQSAAIEKEVEKQLRSQVRGIAARLVQSVADNAEAKWKLDIKVSLGEQR